MKKELKDQIIETISAQLKEYPNFYVTDIAGLNAKDTGKLRRACFEEGIKLSVVKNTLFAHVLKGIDNPEMQKLIETLKGNTAIMYCNVPNAPGKPRQNTQKPPVAHGKTARAPVVPQIRVKAKRIGLRAMRAGLNAKMGCHRASQRRLRRPP